MRVLDALLQLLVHQHAQPNRIFAQIVSVLTQLKDVAHARRSWGVFPLDSLPQLFREIVLCCEL